MRLIDADLMSEAIRRVKESSDRIADRVYCDYVLKMLDRMKTVDAAPVQYAEWIKTDYKPRFYKKCSNCGWRVNKNEYPNYCPNCGAKMDGGEGK